MRKALIPAALALILTGCIGMPEIPRPKLDLPEPQAPTLASARIAPTWWKAYGDPVLDQLMDEAFAHNDDLHLAAARVEEARSAYGLAEGARYPTAGIGLGASRRRSTEVGSFPVPEPVNNSFQVGLQAAYEVDLWGRLRHASASARADLLRTRHARDVIRIVLADAVAQGYFALRALDAQRELAERTLENRRQVLSLQKVRVEVGDASEYEYHASLAEVAGTESVLARITRQVSLRETALAQLLGRQPRQLVESGIQRGNRIDQLTLPPTVPADLPSDLLLRRPDIRQAEQALAAAEARIDEAKAAIFPSLSLTANLGSESKALSDLFSGPANVWGLAATLAQTLYNAGRTEAAVEGAVARQKQGLIAYEQTVKQAFRETLDALVTLRQARAQAEADTRQAQALGEAFRLANLRYLNGVASFIEVLDAQRGLFSAQQNALDSRRGQLAATSSLYMALGGGWTPEETSGR